jgi:hypothetical protein
MAYGFIVNKMKEEEKVATTGCNDVVLRMNESLE